MQLARKAEIDIRTSHSVLEVQSWEPKLLQESPGLEQYATQSQQMSELPIKGKAENYRHKKKTE